jgi:hypothetical protein
LDASFPARSTAQQAAHQLFLYNCSSEIVREVRARLGGSEILYEPSIGPGKFAELPWTKNEAIRSTALRATRGALISQPLEVDFAIDEGVKWARLSGELTLHETDGWIRFRSKNGAEKELE